MNPNQLFTRLGGTFSQNIARFYDAYLRSIQDIKKFKPPAEYCHSCVGETVDNLDDLFSRFEHLASFILFKAYSIELKT